MIKLSAAQKEQLKPHLERFVASLGSDQGKGDQQERVARVRYFQEELPGRLDDLSEVDVEDLVRRLWASRLWGNKQWLAQKVIDDNGLDTLREELRNLLNRSDPPGARYERAVQRIARLGPASVTEMLCYADPEHCGIWNDRARSAIKRLGLTREVPPEKYRISGAEYEAFNSLASAIGLELEAAGVQHPDLLVVNSLLYEISEAKELPAKPAAPEVFDHDEIRDLIQSIGSSLGFDAEVEQRIARGATVDVVWRARIGNLGMVKYVFEVHKAGSIDSLLLNLQKARADASVQKVIAVSDEVQLRRIENETEGLQEEFRRSLGFWPVSEVQAVAEHLQLAVESINQLGLVPGI